MDRKNKIGNLQGEEIYNNIKTTYDVVTIVYVMYSFGSALNVDGVTNYMTVVKDALRNAANDNWKVPMSTINTTKIEKMPQYVQDIYKKYNSNGWKGNVPGQTPGTNAGRAYKNNPSSGETKLPNNVTYKEFDVNNKIAGQSRDAERFIRGSDGSIYYTKDHYKTFEKIIE